MQPIRRLSRNPTFASISYHYQKTVGHKVRDLIDKTSEVLKPFQKYIVPNFVAVHYVYIISMAMLGSILIYPLKNIAYIDALFFAAGAATQGGLNTVDVTDLTLYQQIVIYIICITTTPIVVHSGLAFVRLYWFERYFDGVKDSSKRNFKMRRTRTILERELTSNTNGPRSRIFTTDQHSTVGPLRNFNENLFSGKFEIGKNSQSLDDSGVTTFNQHTDKLETDSKASNWSSSKTIKPEDNPRPHIGELRFEVPVHAHNKKENSKISEKFVGRRKSAEFNPADMYRSISMLRTSTEPSEDMEGGEKGPPLVVRGPREIAISSDESFSGKSYPNNESFNGTASEDNTKLPNDINPTHEINDTDQNKVQLNTDKLKFSIPKPKRNSKNCSQIRNELDNIPSQYLRRRKQNKISRKQVRKNKHQIVNQLQNAPKHLIKQSTYFDANDTHWEQYGLYSPEDVQFYSQSPEFQKLVYRTWKENNKKSGILSKINIRDNQPLFYRPFGVNTENLEEGASSPEKSEDISDLHSKNYNNSTNYRGYFNTNEISPNDSDAVLEANMYFPGMNDENTGSKRINSFDLEDHENMSLPRTTLARTMSTGYLSWQPTLGRNSVFVGLTRTQRDELGGVEYRAIKLLCTILVCYYVGFHCFGFTMLLPWICSRHYYTDILRADSIAPAWWAFFTPMSSFSNMGLTLTSNSMMSFNSAIFPLIVIMALIILGNTGFPVMLRFIIWIMFKLSPDLSQSKESLGFLLDHPRRCFTLLFPSGATWWLFTSLVGLNAVDLILFIILDMNVAVLKPLSTGIRVLDGLFQAVSTRTAGLSVVNLSLLRPSIQVSYMIMMYISVLPLAISIRRTNVYEEQSLGIYRGYSEIEEEDSDEEVVGSCDNGKNSKKKATKHKKKPILNKSFIGAHLRRQLSFDMWFLFLGLFIICISEGGKIQNPEMPAMNVFSIFFEIVSAYGTVGLSLGYPGTDPSLSGQFTVISKLVIIATLIRGRHRGLPYTIDRAILLPSDKLEHIDHIESQNRKAQYGNEDTTDPITIYFRKKSTAVLNFVKTSKDSEGRSGDETGINSNDTSILNNESSATNFNRVDKTV